MRVLIIDDDPHDAALAMEAVGARWPMASIELSDKPCDWIGDVAFIDANLGNFCGLSIASELSKSGSVVILMSGIEVDYDARLNTLADLFMIKPITATKLNTVAELCRISNPD